MIDRSSLDKIPNIDHSIIDDVAVQKRPHEQHIQQKLEAFNSEKISSKSYCQMKNNTGAPKFEQLTLPEGDGTIVHVLAN